MSNVYLAIGAHVGDAELTSGCVLATEALKGNKIITLALTAGERGNPPHLSVSEYRKQKIAEAKKFAKKLGGEALVLDYEDGLLPDNEEVRLKVAEVIRKYKPKMIFTHWKNSMHKDHELTYKIVKDAQFYAGVKGFERSLPPHFAAGPYYAENWEDPEDFHPYMYVKVSEEGFKLWSDAISNHWFAVNSKSFEYKSYYEGLMKVRGREARTKYACAFDVEYISKRIIKDSF